MPTTKKVKDLELPSYSSVVIGTRRSMIELKEIKIIDCKQQRYLIGRQVGVFFARTVSLGEGTKIAHATP
jgi:hypothetical protein